MTFASRLCIFSCMLLAIAFAFASDMPALAALSAVIGYSILRDKA